MNLEWPNQPNIAGRVIRKTIQQGIEPLSEFLPFLLL
jgi:hypothetical protein